MPNITDRIKTAYNKRLAKKRFHRFNKVIASNNVHLKELT